MTDVKDSTTKNRRILIILLIIFLGPLFYAIWLFNTDWRPTGTSNHGTLIIPARPLQAFSLQTLTGNRLSLDDMKNKWAMIYVGPAICKKACKDNLYKMRQVHTLQAKHQPRVQRLMVITDKAGLSELQIMLNKEYPKMIVAINPASEIKKISEINKLIEQFKIINGEVVELQHRIYLMDPLGNLMMYYPPDTDGRDIHKDLKKLLRRSQIG